MTIIEMERIPFELNNNSPIRGVRRKSGPSIYTYIYICTIKYACNQKKRKLLIHLELISSSHIVIKSITLYKSHIK